MFCVSAWNLPVLNAGGFAPANYYMGSNMLTARQCCHWTEDKLGVPERAISCSGWWAGADIHLFCRFLLFKPISVFMAPLAMMLPCFRSSFASALKVKGRLCPISIAEYFRKIMVRPLFREGAVNVFVSHHQNNVAIPPNDKRPSLQGRGGSFKGFVGGGFRGLCGLQVGCIPRSSLSYGRRFQRRGDPFGSSTTVTSMPLNNASQAAVSTDCRGFGKGN
jgi:hypothetical protein